MKHSVLAFAFLLLGALASVSCKKDSTEDGFARTDELAYLQGFMSITPRWINCLTAFPTSQLQ